MNRKYYGGKYILESYRKFISEFDDLSEAEKEKKYQKERGAKNIKIFEAKLLKKEIK